MPVSLPSKIAGFSRKRAVRRTAIGLGSLFLLFVLFGFFALPGIVKSQIGKVVEEKLHRKATVEDVKFNPLTLDMALHGFKLMEADGEAVFASFETLDVNVSTQSVFRLAPVVQHIKLGKPYVHIVRTGANSYNFDDIVEALNSQPPSDEPARFSVNNIQLEGGRIAFDDKPVRKTHEITDLSLGIPFISSLPSQVQIFVEPLLSAKINGTPLQLKGKARPYAQPRDAIVDLSLQDFDLAPYVDYLPVKPRVKVPSARLDMQLSANFVQPEEQKPALTLNGSVKLKSVQVNELNGKPVLKLPELAVQLHDASVFAERIDVASVIATGLEANVARDANGELNLLGLMPPSSGKPAAGAQKETASPVIGLGEVALRGAALRYADQQAASQAGADKFDLALRQIVLDLNKRSMDIGEVASGSAAFFMKHGKGGKQAESKPEPKPESSDGKPFAVNVGKIGLANWSARIEDNTQVKPLVTSIDPLSLSVQQFSTVSPTPARIDLKATVNKSGQLAVTGGVGLSPVQTDLAIDAKNVDILPLQPLVANQVNLRVMRAELNANGKFQMQLAPDGTMKGGYKGSAGLANLATIDHTNGNEFLRWKSLHAGGIDVRLQPLSVTIGQVALSDFFARVIIDPSGRINLQDVMRKPSEQERSLTDDTVPEKSAAQASAPQPQAKTVQAAPQPAEKEAAAPMPPVKIGRLTLQGGRVRFTDNFIRPNYTANLANFGGVVKGLSSDPESTANVDLRGEVNSAPLTVAGTINPLKKDLFLDLKANVRGMELAPLSTYSGRYVGYGIEKGKLSFEVAYRVANRELKAENRLILDQLTFGKKVDSPNALNLPVQFAVSLLADRNGVIDVNLPIGGSLDDPQFSIGGLILKVIGNLIVKAVTAPFSLIGSLFGGGGEDMAALEFDAGRAAIPQAGESKLQSMAKLLEDRPALKLEISGRVDTETDLEGLKRASINRKVRALKAKDQGASFSDVTVSAEEYPALLARVYKDEKFPKPRNMIGLAKSLPVEEMEKLMLANATVDEDDLSGLGTQRAQNVKSWLMKQGVPAERLFIVATKLGKADGKDEKPASRVDFALK